MPDTLTVVIADDHPLFRSGVRQILDGEPSLKVIGEAGDGEEAFNQIVNLKPNVAVLDINMPKLTGLAIAQRAGKMDLDTSIILLTMLEDKKVFLEAMDAGVRGYLLKDSAVTEILHAIVAIRQGRHYLSPVLSGILLRKKARSGEEIPASFKDLTPAEVRILRLIADLKTNQEIADELFLSKRTVENNRVNIARKLNLPGTNGVLKFALEHKADLD